MTGANNMTLEESKQLLSKLELLLKLQNKANESGQPKIIDFVTKFVDENK
jgi:hypothetical protein